MLLLQEQLQRQITIVKYPEAKALGAMRGFQLHTFHVQCNYLGPIELGSRIICKRFAN